MYKGEESMNIDKVFKIEKDIQEIDDVLNPNAIFNRKKAEDIIRKHNATDTEVAIFNSPLNSYYVAFENATDKMVKNNLISIRNILAGKLLQESSKK